jgi:hypothetical protein
VTGQSPDLRVSPRTRPSFKMAPGWSEALGPGAHPGFLSQPAAPNRWQRVSGGAAAGPALSARPQTPGQDTCGETVRAPGPVGSSPVSASKTNGGTATPTLLQAGRAHLPPGRPGCGDRREARLRPWSCSRAAEARLGWPGGTVTGSPLCPNVGATEGAPGPDPGGRCEVSRSVCGNGPAGCCGVWADSQGETEALLTAGHQAQGSAGLRRPEPGGRGSRGWPAV